MSSAKELIDHVVEGVSPSVLKKLSKAWSQKPFDKNKFEFKYEDDAAEFSAEVEELGADAFMEKSASGTYVVTVK